MALYIEEGPNLPTGVTLERCEAEGWLVWDADGREQCVGIDCHQTAHEMALAAGWIVVREEEPTPPTPDEHPEFMRGFRAGELFARCNPNITEEPTPPKQSTIEAMTAEGWGDDDGDLSGWVIGCEAAARVADRLVNEAVTFSDQRGPYPEPPQPVEEPTPPTPDVGWIGTDTLPGHQRVVCEWVGEADKIGKAVLYRNPFNLLYVDKLSRFTWEPPPVEEPAPKPPRCGHHGNPLMFLDYERGWRCPDCYPEMFPPSVVASSDLESQMQSVIDVWGTKAAKPCAEVAAAAVEAARQEGERAGVLRARNIIRPWGDRDLPLLDIATIDRLAAYLDRTLAEDYPL